MPDRRDPTDALGALIREAAAVSAPASLRAEVARMRLPAEAGHRRRPLLPIALVTALAAGGLAAALVATTGSAGAPAVADVATAALRAPTQPAPAPSRQDESLVARAVDGVAFPNYAYRTRWQVLGARVDRLGGHTVTTVAYARPGLRIGYAIVTGQPLPEPPGATLTRGALRLTALRVDGAAVVTWRRDGRTCVLVSRDTGPGALAVLAAWTGRTTPGKDPTPAAS